VHDLSQLVDALTAAELGAEAVALPRETVHRFLDEAVHFRRSVAYASLKLIARLAGDREAQVRARAAAALVDFADLYEAEVERITLAAAEDPVPSVRAAASAALSALLDGSREPELLAERWRARSPMCREALQRARRGGRSPSRNAGDDRLE
jgi:hypothetical protein